jgi:hypothetical protein
MKVDIGFLRYWGIRPISGFKKTRAPPTKQSWLFLFLFVLFLGLMDPRSKQSGTEKTNSGCLSFFTPFSFFDLSSTT